MPSPQSANKRSPATRTILIWVFMAALAVVVWQMVEGSNDSGAGHRIGYSEFLQHVDKHNIATATLVLSPNTAEVHGKLRVPPQDFRTTVPSANASDLTDPLRQNGVNVEVSRAPVWTGELLTFAPALLLIAVLWIFIIMKPMRAKKAPPSNISNPSNMPL